MGEKTVDETVAEDRSKALNKALSALREINRLTLRSDPERPRIMTINQIGRIAERAIDELARTP